MKFTVTCKEFSRLTPHELYEILKLRSEVFVVEQNCVFLDPDGKDPHCAHVMVWTETGKLVACSRLVPPGASYPEMSIGRIVSAASVRGAGAGKLLMEKSLALLFDRFGPGPVKIGAQLYLKTFYGSFGFVQSSDVYDEDGIDHIEMIRS
jgi:ElaA protein